MATIYELGPYRLDSGAEILFRNSNPVALGRRAIAVLRVLVERPGVPVTRDALIEAAWPGLAVEEGNLTVQIAALRRVFSQEPNGESWIETLPRRGYRYVGPVTGTDGENPTAATATQATSKLSLADKPSIAVLPFDNLSGDPEQEYFADGLTEDLITDLSKVRGLFVIARNSSFVFKNQTINVRWVAEELGVRYVLEGSVRKADRRVRINAQLIDTASGGHIWAERYDGNLEDIFSLQDDITAQIVLALKVSLAPGDKVLAERKPTDSVEAYDLFLRGRAHYYRYTPEDLLKAIECLEDAIAVDPNFGAAYGYLSYCYFQGWCRMWPRFDVTLDRANELAERGVALNATSATAIARLGWIQTFLRRYNPAIANLEKATSLAPNNAEVIATFAQVLNYWGDPERGLQMQERAFSLDAFAPTTWEWHIGISHLLLRHYEEAIAISSRAAPKFTYIYMLLAWAYAELDRPDDAREAIEKLLESLPRYTIKEVARIYPFRLDEHRNRFLDGLRKAGLPEG